MGLSSRISGWFGHSSPTAASGMIEPPSIASSYAAVGLIGRHCIGTLAFAHYCHHRPITHAILTDFVNHMWRLPTHSEWGQWERELVELPFGGFATGDPLPSELEPVLVTASVDQTELRQLAESTVEVSLCSFYAAVNDTESLKQLDRTLSIATRYGFILPDVTAFDSCRFADYHGWGHAPSASVLRLWHSYQHT